MEINKQNSIKENCLKCPICYETFSQIHKPLLIPCGHTICSNCLEQLKKLSREDEESDYSSRNSLDISLSESSESDIEENTEESEDSDDSDEASENSQENIIEIIEPKIEKPSNAELHKKIRLKCSICRTKMKIYVNEIVENKGVIQFLEIIDSKEGVKNIQQAPVKIFCKICKCIDNEISHLQLHEQHKSSLVHLDDSSFKEMKNIKIDEELNSSIIEILRKFTSEIFNNEKFKTGEAYLKEYFKMYSVMTYFKNKTHKNFTKLYEKFNTFINENKFDKAENFLQNSSDLAKKYYTTVNKKLAMQENIIIKLKKNTAIPKNIVNHYLDHLYCKLNSQTDSFKKFLAYAGPESQSIYIFDIRVMYDIYIPYDKIFDSFNQEKPEDYNTSKNYSEWVDIDNDGKFIFILGKVGQASKKFRMFNVLERTLETKPDVPTKFEIFDRYYHNRRLFVFGGSVDGVTIKTCYFYDLDGNYWFDLPDLNLRRYKKSISVMNNVFYVHSGFGQDESEYKFEKLDLNDDKDPEWKLLEIKNYRAALTQPFTGFVSNHHLIILGGQEVENYDNSMKGYLIDIASQEMVEEFEVNKSEIYDTMGNFNGYLVGSTSDGAFQIFDTYKNLNKLKTLI
jgi:hypothetical protein